MKKSLQLSLLLFFLQKTFQQVSDPCLKYWNGTNHCMSCANGTIFTLVNSTTTLCGTKVSDTCVLDSNYYSNDPAFNQSFQFLSTYLQSKQYCMNCTTFYQMEDGRNLCYGQCPQSRTPYYEFINIDILSIGCQQCALQDYQMRTILDYSFIDLYVKTCTQNIEQTACQFTEYYDFNLKRCVACIDKFSKCSACTADQCLITQYQYYSGDTFYNYTSQSFTSTLLQYFLCPAGTGSPSAGNQCVKSNIPHCLQTFIPYNGTEECLLCESEYSIPNCDPKSYSTGNFNIFVSSDAIYNTTDFSIPGSYFQTMGMSPDSPIRFIPYAIFISEIMAMQSFYQVNMTIYLGKGDHFFFHCFSKDVSTFNTPDIVQYCKMFGSSISYFFATTDNFELYFKPLYCSLAKELNYVGNPNFAAMCIDDSKGDKPQAIIYVNQAFSYFNIYGFAQFENIMFTGINQLVQPVIPTNDLSSLPIKYCELEEEPQIGDQQLKLRILKHTNFNVEYKCTNVNYTGSTIPQNSHDKYTCSRNQDQTYYQKQESTFSAAGEPNYFYYFYKHNPYIDKMFTKIKRSNTLFNIYTAPEYLSARKKPPEVHIINCTFTYFLQNYESLISVPNKDFQYQQIGDIGKNDAGVYKKTMITAQSGERGAKISVVNSQFKHSAFTKGLIAYRKQPYIDNQVNSFGNLTYILMNKHPLVQDQGSYILLQNSSFINLNAGFQNISALAMYGGKEVMMPMNYNNTIIESQAFIHKGTVINVEDFGGIIKVVNCTFRNNMHFIPSIMNTNRTVKQTGTTDISQFLDSSQTFEYKLSICNQETKEDSYLFTEGIGSNTDLDSLYDTFERLSTIYISRNRDMVIIQDNLFEGNIGTFGGAISINSQNWEGGKKAYVIIQNNQFKKNMAYLSGNAIYIRNSLKQLYGSYQICGGISIVNNSFINNIGMKHHNGGAVSLLCHYATSESQDDYFSTSGKNFSQNLNFFDEQEVFVDSLDNQTTYKVHSQAVNIENCSFDSNYAGSKGTALYLKQISNVKINNCSFINNGPVLSSFEELYSPYVQYLSNRTITYYDAYSQVCSSEFDYIATCQYSSEMTIDWSYVFGALYIEQCESADCLLNNYIMNFQLSNSQFINNQAGYIMDSTFPNNMSSQLFIKGGFNNQIINCTFDNSNGSYSQFIPQSLKDYFPQDYFTYQQSSLIQIDHNPAINQEKEFLTQFTNCDFSNNKHIQPLGLGSQQNYYGSLIACSQKQSLISTLTIPILKIQNSRISQNKFIGSKTSLIYIQNSLIQLVNSNFTNNGIYSLKRTQSNQQDLIKIMTKYNFYSFNVYDYQEFQEYGLLYLEGIQKFNAQYHHNLENNTFLYSISKYSPVLQLNIGSQFIQLKNNNFLNNFAAQGGIISSTGLIYSNLQEQNYLVYKQKVNTTFLVDGDSYIQQISNQGIFTFILDSQYLDFNFILQNSHFFDNFQNDEYSVLSFQEVRKVIVKSSSFSSISTREQLYDNFQSQFHQSTSKIITLTDFFNISLLLDSTITDYFAGSRFLTANSTSNQNQELYFGNMKISIDSLYYQYIELIDSSFSNFYSKHSGALLTLTQNSLLFMETNQFLPITNCSVGEQGIIYLTNSHFVGQQTTILNSYSNGSAALFYLNAESTVDITGGYFSNNSAYTYGLILMTGNSFFSCSYCEFIDNHVTVDSSILYADNNPNSFIHFQGCTFNNNTSLSNVINMITTELKVEDSQFIDNFSQLVNNGITATNSLVQLNRVLVNYTDQNFINNNTFTVDSCFLNINFQSVLRISESQIFNCRGGSAGVLYATGYSQIYIGNNSVFEDNLSSQDANGGAFYFLTIQTVEISDSSFSRNGIVDIQLQRSKATITNSTFSQGYQQFIQGQVADIQIINSTFKDGINNNIFGKALNCYCTKLLISNSFFTNLQAVKGGALFLSSKDSSSSFIIQNNTFQSNQAQSGGSIFVQDAANLQLKRNLFIGNQAKVISPPTDMSQQLLKKGQGGGIYLQCLNQEATLNNNCAINLTNSNVFINNSAQNDGGAIFSIANPYYQDSSNVFLQNSALYGQNLGTYPKQLDFNFLSNGDYYDPLISSNTSLRDLASTSSPRANYTLNKLVSGIPFQLNIKIKDQGSSLYLTDSQSVASLKNMDSSQYILLNGHEVKANNGIYNFQSVTAITYPGSNITLTLNISGLTDYGNSIQFLDYPFTVLLQFRKCVQGESMVSYSCIKCPSGEYLYEAPQNNTICKTCDASAICNGGAEVFPIAGYWRDSNISEVFINCPRKYSCLMGDSLHPIGICEVGYQGIVCGVCSRGFSKQGDFECAKCPKKAQNIAQITFIILAITLIVIALVKSSFSSSKKQKATYSIMIKILTSHFQIVSAISNIKFEWPSYILALYNSIVTVSSTSQQVLSIDCLLMDSNSILLEKFGIYFSKLLFYALLPIFLALIDLIYFLIYCSAKRNFKNFCNYFMSTFVIMLFLVHPTITQQMFQAFNCIKLGDAYHLRQDVTYECYQGQHKRFLIFIVIPSIIVWSFGIPLVALLILYRNKKTIMKEQSQNDLSYKDLQEVNNFKQKFGFLYNGFKTQSFQYEIVIQFRKITLIMATVILSVVSPDIQALLALLILALSLFYHYSAQPYQYIELNRMESLSLIIGNTTIYSGLFFITGTHYDYYSSPALQIIFLILLIIPNFLFLVCWLFYFYLEILKVSHRSGTRMFCISSFGLIDYKNFRKKYMRQSSTTEQENNLSIKQDKLEKVSMEQSERKEKKKQKKERVEKNEKTKKSRAKTKEFVSQDSAQISPYKYKVEKQKKPVKQKKQNQASSLQEQQYQFGDSSNCQNDSIDELEKSGRRLVDSYEQKKKQTKKSLNKSKKKYKQKLQNENEKNNRENIEKLYVDDDEMKECN